MSYLSSLNHVIGYDDKIRRRKEPSDPFVEHLREVLPRDGTWEVFR